MDCIYFAFIKLIIKNAFGFGPPPPCCILTSGYFSYCSCLALSAPDKSKQKACPTRLLPLLAQDMEMDSVQSNGLRGANALKWDAAVPIIVCKVQALGFARC